MSDTRTKVDEITPDYSVDQVLEELKHFGANAPVDARETGELEVLKRHPLFTGLQKAAFQGLLARDKPILLFEPGEHLSRQGEPVNTILLVLAGRAKASLQADTPDSLQIVLDLLGPGSSIGMLSLIDKGPHSASVTAITKLKALALDFPNMRLMLEIHRDWYRVLAEMAAERLRNSSTWMQALLT